MDAIINGGDSDESSKSGGSEVFIRDGARRNSRYISGSAVLNREAQCCRGHLQKSGATRYYSVLCPIRMGGRRTPLVAEADSKMEFGTNREEVK